MRPRLKILKNLHLAMVVFSRNSQLRAAELFDGLSVVAFSVLSYVDRTLYPNASELAKQFNLDKSTVSRQLAQLEGDGLLRRVADPTRPRMKILEITKKGRRHLAAVETHQQRALLERFKDWPDDDVAAFATLFWRFLDGDQPNARTRAALSTNESKGRPRDAKHR
ncbi:MAG: MarR family transcriptional regulator [Polyangiaceae bacterium]